MTDTQQQLAASRMQTATLHSALVEVKMAMEQGMSLDGHVAANGPTIGEAIDRALGASEPEILALLADADRQAKVDRLNAAAKEVVETLDWSIDDPGRPSGGESLEDVQARIRALQEALLP